MKCPLCEKEYRARTTLKIHLKKEHQLHGLELERTVCDTVYGKQVVDFWLEKYKNCEISYSELGGNGGSDLPSIRKLVVLMGIKRSPSEEHNTDRYRAKYLETIQQKYGENITNISQVEEIQRKKEETQASHYGSYDEYLKCCRERMKLGSKRFWGDAERVEKWKENYKSSLREKYGEDITNVAQIPEVSKKISDKQREHFAKMTSDEKRQFTENMRRRLRELVSQMSKTQRKEYFKRKKPYIKKDFTTRNEKYVSSQEKRIWGILESENIQNFLHNCFVFNMNFDVIFPEEHIVLEIQGDFWHCNPKIYKENDLVKRPGSKRPVSVKKVWERDYRRKFFMEKHGWSVRYLWENEINDCDDKTLLELIKSVVPEIFKTRKS